MYGTECTELTGLEVPLVCLALAVYEEARGEPLVGQEAVAMVVLNRARQAHRPVCQVVFAPGQFSWTKGFHSKVNTHSNLGSDPKWLPNGFKPCQTSLKVQHHSILSTLVPSGQRTSTTLVHGGTSISTGN